MARLNRNRVKQNIPVEPRIHWIVWLNTALILSLWALVLLERFKWNG
jgi:hypothetical protein